MRQRDSSNGSAGRRMEGPRTRRPAPTGMPAGCIAHAQDWDGGGAVARRFGAAAPRLLCGSLDAVHAAVAQGQCQLGLLPLESSLDGMVNRSHDLLFAGAVQVVGELLHAPDDIAAARTVIRFGLIAAPGHPSGECDDRLMVAALLPQRAGSLLDMLEPFARRALPIAHWCSRPARVDGWHYRFHFTLCARVDGEDVRQSLRDASERSSELRLLGRFQGSSRA